MNPVQKMVYSYMKEFFQENDQLPPAHLVAEHFGWKARQNAVWHINKLEQHGFKQGGMMDVYEMGQAIIDLQKRVSALESKDLEFPPIDLGLIPGVGPEPNHPFEPFEYTERS